MFFWKSSRLTFEGIIQIFRAFHKGDAHLNKYTSFSQNWSLPKKHSISTAHLKNRSSSAGRVSFDQNLILTAKPTARICSGKAIFSLDIWHSVTDLSGRKIFGSPFVYTLDPVLNFLTTQMADDENQQLFYNVISLILRNFTASRGAEKLGYKYFRAYKI